jgi:hypothetical protein
MGEAGKAVYLPNETVSIDCDLAVRKDGCTCGVQYGRACDGKLRGKPGGKKYKCKTTGLDIELREPAAP